MGLFTVEKKDGGKPSQGFFAPKPQPHATVDLSKVMSQIGNMNSRLRMAEERYSNTRDKLQFMEENMLHADTRIKDSIKVLTSDLDELKEVVNKVKQDMGLVIKELQNLAKKQDLDTLQKYVDLWNPVKFVTSKEVMKMIDEVVTDKLSDLNLRIQEENFIEEQIKAQLKKMLQARKNKD